MSKLNELSVTATDPGMSCRIQDKSILELEGAGFHQTRFRRANQEMSGDVAIFQDADLEYDPQDSARLLAPILDGRADVVFGSRLTGAERKVLYFWHTVGNRLLTLLANMLNDMNLTGMESCYMVFTAEALRALPFEEHPFRRRRAVTRR